MPSTPRAIFDQGASTMVSKTSEAETGVSEATLMPRHIQRSLAEALSTAPMSVTTQEQATAASALLRSVRTRSDELTELRLSLTRPLDEVKKRTMALFAPALDRLNHVQTETRRALVAYTDERERIVREQVEAARLAAEREAAEQRRIAQIAEVMGDEEGAYDARRASAEAETALIDVPPPPRVAGFSTRPSYSVRVTDLRALCAAVAAGTASADYLQPNQSVLNAVARSAKDAFSIPGCELVKTTTGVSR